MCLLFVRFYSFIYLFHGRGLVWRWFRYSLQDGQCRYFMNKKYINTPLHDTTSSLIIFLLPALEHVVDHFSVRRRSQFFFRVLLHFIHQTIIYLYFFLFTRIDDNHKAAFAARLYFFFCRTEKL